MQTQDEEKTRRGYSKLYLFTLWFICISSFFCVTTACRLTQVLFGKFYDRYNWHEAFRFQKHHRCWALLEASFMGFPILDLTLGCDLRLSWAWTRVLGLSTQVGTWLGLGIWTQACQLQTFLWSSNLHVQSSWPQILHIDCGDLFLLSIAVSLGRDEGGRGWMAKLFSQGEENVITVTFWWILQNRDKILEDINIIGHATLYRCTCGHPLLTTFLSDNE